jgi:sarcosine oxidase gamma subunit
MDVDTARIVRIIWVDESFDLAVFLSFAKHLVYVFAHGTHPMKCSPR